MLCYNYFLYFLLVMIYLLVRKFSSFKFTGITQSYLIHKFISTYSLQLSHFPCIHKSVQYNDKHDPTFALLWLLC